MKCWNLKKGVIISRPTVAAIADCAHSDDHAQNPFSYI